MNKSDKTDMKEIYDSIDRAKSDLENMRDGMQEEYDDLDDKLQEGEKGEKLQGEITALEEAIDACDTALSSIDTATGA